MTESATSARKVLARQREAQAVKLRINGAEYAEIGALLGISKQAAWKLVSNYLKATRAQTGEDANVLRDLELQRLDALYMAMHPQAVKGNQGAVDRCLRIMERRAKLEGLDAPTKNEVTGARGGPVEVETTFKDAILRKLLTPDNDTPANNG